MGDKEIHAISGYYLEEDESNTASPNKIGDLPRKSKDRENLGGGVKKRKFDLEGEKYWLRWKHSLNSF